MKCFFILKAIEEMKNDIDIMAKRREDLQAGRINVEHDIHKHKGYHIIVLCFFMLWLCILSLQNDHRLPCHFIDPEKKCNVGVLKLTLTLLHFWQFLKYSICYAT